jgi:hypothetical protein
MAEQVGVLDVVAMADVVADHQRRFHVTAGLWAGLRRAEQAQAAPEGGPGHQLPHAPDAAVDGREKGAFDAHCIVLARGGHPWILEVADNVDAADEGDPPVDDGQLAMQSAQASATQGQGADFPAVDEHVHAGIHQPLHHLGDKLAAAEAVHQHAHRDPRWAARRRASAISWPVSSLAKM